jgi:hypothetical protein
MMRASQLFGLAWLLVGTASAWGQTPPTIVPPTPVSQSSQATEPSMFDGGFGEDDLPQPITARPNLFWIRADYLLWTITKEPITPIIQRIPDSLATAPSLPAGSGISVFPNNNELEYQNFKGVRLNTGFWFGAGSNWGLDVSGFALEKKSLHAFYASQGSPILTRFYNDIGDDQETYLLFSNIDPANSYSGSIGAGAEVSNLYSVDASLRYNGFRVFADNADWLFGLRYMKFDESLFINSVANLSDGRILQVNDRYDVRNDFYGAQIGLNSRWVGWRGFSYDGTFKLAVGGVRQRATVGGYNAFINQDGTVDAQNTGLWATGSQIGSFSKGKFAVIPEANFNLSYNVTDRFAITVGYTAMIISNVVRVGSIINPNVNETTLRYVGQTRAPDGQPNPQFRFNDTGMWIQGVNFGFRFEF